MGTETNRAKRHRVISLVYGDRKGGLEIWGAEGPGPLPLNQS